MIPLEQGSVFRRLYCLVTSGDLGLSQSLWNRAVSSDGMAVESSADVVSSQSLWNRAVSSDLIIALFITSILASQSLWNRAVSSDKDGSCRGIESVSVSIPLEQGSVFRHRLFGYAF